MATTDIPMVPTKGHTGLAWVVVLTIAAVGLVFIIISMFSQDNAPATVDGDRAVESQYIDDGE